MIRTVARINKKKHVSAVFEMAFDLVLCSGTHEPIVVKCGFAGVTYSCEESHCTKRRHITRKLSCRVCAPSGRDVRMDEILRNRLARATVQYELAESERVLALSRPTALQSLLALLLATFTFETQEDHGLLHRTCLSRTIRAPSLTASMHASDPMIMLQLS
jgi:hypothetical protein